MSFWGDKVWNHQVHKQLGESLYYYLVDVRPFEPPKAVASLRHVIAERELGSTRIFTVFGAYDLMVRAWIHPSIAGALPGWLDTALGGKRVQDLQIFAVTEIHKRWYDSQLTEEGVKLINTLNEGVIKKAQLGDAALVDGLSKQHLVIQRGALTSPLIKFFVAVKFANDNAGITHGTIRDIEEHIAQDSRIQYVSIYRGYGFASILITGHVNVQDYFHIGDLPHWISERFKHFEASTETFLVMAKEQIAGDAAIGGATFKALTGKNLLVQSIIPELYEGTYSQAKKSVVDSFVLKNLSQIVLTDRDRTLLHDCLLGYINDDPAEMAKTLLIFLVGLGSYLRQAMGEYVGKYSEVGLGALMQQANIAKADSKFLVLGDLLRLYGLSVPEEYQQVVKDLQPLTEIRNGLAHEGTDVLENWEKHLERLVQILPAARRFVEFLQEIRKAHLSS